jgi:L-threonylcarbamoyladenylate synthase
MSDPPTDADRDDEAPPPGTTLDGGDGSAVAAAAAILQRGGLVAFPTETVYGLGADATDPTAVERIFRVKGRPADHPLIVHLPDAAGLTAWTADLPHAARSVVEAFWPGPLTVVLRRSDRVPDAVTGGRDTVGLRVPDHPVALALLRAFGGGVAAPSANRFGRVSPTSAADVAADLGTDVDLILDGGSCVVGVESTILDLSTGVPEILRPGGISAAQLGQVLGTVPETWRGEGAARAPGMLAAHYAPTAEVRVVAREALDDEARGATAAGRVVGVLAPRALEGLDVIELEPAGDAEHYAHVLYARLRQADRLGVDLLLVVPPPDEGVGRAVNDRLRRAATGSRRA